MGRGENPLTRRYEPAIVVGAASIVVCFGMGALFSLGVFLKPIADDTGWSRSAISLTATLNWVFTGLGAFVWGALSNRFPPRVLAVLGGLLLGAAFVVSSQASTLGQFYVAFGVLVGFASGAFYAPLVAVATRWVRTRRGLAVGAVSAGMGLGTLVVATLARLLIDLSSWRAAMLAIGDITWLVIIPVALLVKDPPARGDDAGGLGAAGDPQPSFGAVTRAPQFWLTALAHFFCCTAHSGPLFHMVSHAIDQGVSPLPAATTLGLAGFASIPGRLTTGVIADRFGVRHTLVGWLALQAAIVFLYSFVHAPSGLYALALVFGVAYGGVMPLYALVIREYFGERAMAPAYGAVYFISSVGMGLGSVAGGVVYDHSGSYRWMFALSTAIGLMAMGFALAVRPAARSRPAPGAAGGMKSETRIA